MRKNGLGGEGMHTGSLTQDVVFSAVPADPGYHVGFDKDGNMIPISPEPYPGSLEDSPGEHRTVATGPSDPTTAGALFPDRRPRVTRPLTEDDPAMDPAVIEAKRYAGHVRALLDAARTAGTEYNVNEIHHQALALTEAERGPDPAAAMTVAGAAEGSTGGAIARQESLTVPVDAEFIATTARDMKVREAYEAPNWIMAAYNTALQQAVNDETLTPLLLERLTSVRDAMLARYTPENGMVVADKAYARVLEAARGIQQSNSGAILEAIEGVHRPGPSRLRLAATHVGHAIIGNLAFGWPSAGINRAVAGYADGHRLIQRFADALRYEVYRQSLQLGRDTRQSVQARLEAVALNDGANFIDEFNVRYGDGMMPGQATVQALRAGDDCTIRLRQEVAGDEQQRRRAQQLLAGALSRLDRQEADYDRLTSWLNDDALEYQARSLGDIYARYLHLEDERLLRAEPWRLRPLVTFARRFVA